jgi:hypothetical protein
MRKSLNLRIAAASVVTAIGVTTLSLVAGGSPAPTISTAPASCLSAQIAVTTGASKSQFGPESKSTKTPIIFTNHGAPCYLWGVPVLRAVNGKKHVAVAPFAQNLSMGEMAVRHLVGTNKSVSTIFTDSVYLSLATCHVVDADGIIVGLLGFVSTTYVKLPMTVCSGLRATSTRLIAPGKAG